MKVFVLGGSGLIGSYAGLGEALYSEPNPTETALLGYRRNDVRRAVEDNMQQYRT